MFTKLVQIQNELKAPKGQYNSFGKYKYRSCEDILEALKPILAKYNVLLFISDSIELVGDRYYVKATATVTDCESGESYTVSAYAREEEDKKGMDGSQITGACSSYARKYCLNGLFLIDDTKDADTNEQANEISSKKAEDRKVTRDEVSKIKELAEKYGKDINTILEGISKANKKKIDKLEDMSFMDYAKVLNRFNKIEKESK